MEEERIKKQPIEQEMKAAYLDYSMSVIVGRALPDVRDGLKPVHRRILFAMHQIGLTHAAKFKKSAAVVGDVIAKYHPHGDVAVYDSMVRMAQDWSLRYPLVKGQGNFGNIDGDSAAAYRYTEAKLSKIADEMLIDISKETVDFQDNFDGSYQEPLVLPAKLPNLLVNGSTGIAVGMATNIPPHNLQEVANAIIHLIKNPDAEVEQLLQFVQGPDFPTGGIICGRSGIWAAYKTGKGRLVVRARTHIEEKNEKKSLIVTEIPYMVNKSLLLESIADLVNEKVVEGISDIRDESDREGMRIVIEIKRNEDPNVVLNQLYKHAQLQETFGVIMLALDGKQPKVMTLKEILAHYIAHRKEVVARRTKFDLTKAEERAHIVEGLRIALANVDPIVKGIKASKTVELAREFLMKNYKLSEIQAQAILDMKLQRFTSLETEKIQEEFKELLKTMEELRSILASDEKVLNIIQKEVEELKENYKDERKTTISDDEEDVDIEDLIPQEDVVVTMTSSGYVKRLPIEEYKTQHRGGIGVKGAEKKEEDIVESLFTTSTHNYLLCFSTIGRIYWLKVYQIPEASKYAKGKAIVNLLNLKAEEKITAVIPIKQFDDRHFLMMATKKGVVKKTPLNAYSHPRKGGIIGIQLREGDELVTVRLTPGTLKFILGTKKGAAIRFDETDVRSVGRNASGVRGIRLRKDDEVVGMEVAIERGSLLTITENGYGKRSPVPEYRLIGRGGKGVINIKTTERNGNVIGIKTVKDEDEVMILSKKGIVIRIPVLDVPIVSRNTQGVRIMRLKEDDKVSTIDRVRVTVNVPQAEIK